MSALRGCAAASPFPVRQVLAPRLNSWFRTALLSASSIAAGELYSSRGFGASCNDSFPALENYRAGPPRYGVSQFSVSAYDWLSIGSVGKRHWPSTNLKPSGIGETYGCYRDNLHPIGIDIQGRNDRIQPRLPVRLGPSANGESDGFGRSDPR